MAFTKAQLDAYIQGLYDDDGQLSSADNQLIINYILSNGNPEIDPRDLIQMRRGDVADLPTLAQGEPAFTLDSEELFVGGLTGNVGFYTKDYFGTIVSPKFSNGVADATTEIQSKFNSGKDVVIIPSGDYKISNPPLTIPEGVTVIAFGARLFNSTVNANIIKMESNTRLIGAEIEGFSNASYDALGIGIDASGTDYLNYVENISIEKCFIHNFSAIGVYSKFSKDLSIIDTIIKDVVFAGVNTESSKRTKIKKSTIDNIAPGTIGNAYGVTFTRVHNTDIVTNPLSEDCSVVDSVIKNIPLWEGLDTHDGKSISFIGNKIENCKTGIALVTVSKGVSNCIVSDNTINGIGQGAGVVVEGEIGKYAKGNKIIGNTFILCGAEGNATAGAIWVKGYTLNTIVTNNYLEFSYNSAISLAGVFNNECVIADNNIYETFDNISGTCYGINLRANDSDGVVSNNILRHDVANDGFATQVSERGIAGLKSAGNNFLVVNNRNNFVLTYYQLDYTNTTYGTLGDLIIASGVGSPETFVTAPVGSLYLQVNGSTGTTLYVKETGAGNTGWIGK